MTKFFGENFEITTLENFENCPSLANLSDYSLGILSPKKKLTISLHIRKCKKCQEIVNEFKSLPFIKGGKGGGYNNSSLCY